MKLAALLLLIAAAVLGAFSIWGLFTKAGQHRYDEMDALYPALAGIVAGVFAVTALVLWFFSKPS